ncbi:hypothetical protein ACWX0K_14995 [Nitrobacteraceae bacterium UC4446_H13]
MANDFAAQVEAWVAQSEDLLVGVFHEATQRTIDIMQTPGPSKASTKKAIEKGAGLGKNGRNSKKAFGPVGPGTGGGRLPVDTGFLWHSLVVSTEGMPMMRDNPTAAQSYTYNPGPINATIDNASIGQTLFCGYSAKYARKVEFSYGYLFVNTATQRWSQTVNAVVQDLKGRMSK